MATQARLLRVLETGEYLRVGSSKVRKTDVRVVAATNLDFDKAMAAGKFREDLFYRLNQVPLLLPPLRERGDDIHLLFRKFTADFSDGIMPPILGPEAVELMSLPVARQCAPAEEHRGAGGAIGQSGRGCRPAARLPAGTASPMTTLPLDEPTPPGMNERSPLQAAVRDEVGLGALKSLVLKMIQDGRIDTASSGDPALVNRVFGEQGGSEVLRLPERAGRPSRSSRLGQCSPRPRAAVCRGA